MKNHNEKTYSGVIKCTLKTITPIFIPDTNNVKSDSIGHKSYRFFSYKDNGPVIPASEIKGMTRSAFEAVTNSCMSSVDDIYPVSRTTKPKTPGLLKWDDKLKKGCLYKAKRYMLKTKNKGSDSENKNYVIKYDNNKPYIQINGEKYFNGKKINFEEGKAYIKNGYEIGKTVKLIGKGDKIGYLYLGEYKPCTSKDNICEACSLFGTVNKELVVPSRLRFTDANLKTNNSDCFDEDITLQELASPKNTATEFYTVQPEGAKFWNYDFEVVDYKDKQPEYKLIDNLKLRGRKFYWHSDAFYWYRDNMAKTAEKNKRNITIQPLKEDVEFTFNIYYDKLTEDELKELIWVLNIGENDGYTKCHKIGMGKPLGLGSVKIIVNEIKKRKIYLDNDTIKYDNGDDKLKDKDYDKSKDLDKYINYDNTDIENKIDINSPPVKEFLKITDINSTKGLTVSYPFTDKTKISYQWFVNNRKNFNQPEIIDTLPKILDKVLTLSNKTNKNNNNKPQKKNTKEKQYNYTPKESTQKTSWELAWEKANENPSKKNKKK